VEHSLPTAELNREPEHERVHELAREAARRMGMSRTGVIEVVLERLLAEVTEDATGIDGLIAGLQNSISSTSPSPLTSCTTTPAFLDDRRHVGRDRRTQQG